MELFGSTRDAWIAADVDGWLAPNRIYPGVADAIKALMVSHEVYVVTTKQARFTETILRRMAGIDFPAERIFSQTVSGKPKSEVLEALQAKHEGAVCHFVEDKLSTLEKVRRRRGRREVAFFFLRASSPQPPWAPEISHCSRRTPCRWKSWIHWRTGSCTWWTGGTTRQRRGSERVGMTAFALLPPPNFPRWQRHPNCAGFPALE